MILLAKGMYEPWIERRKRTLLDSIEQIFSENGAKGFSLPQGPAFGKISSICISELELRIEEIWKAFLEVFDSDSRRTNSISLKARLEEELRSQSEDLARVMNDEVTSRFGNAMQSDLKDVFLQQLNQEQDRLRTYP